MHICFSKLKKQNLCWKVKCCLTFFLKAAFVISFLWDPHAQHTVNEKWELAFPSTQDKTVTFHQDHNPAWFNRQPKSSGRLVSACQKWSFPKTSNNHQHDPTQIPHRRRPHLSVCRLVLCWDWRLRLNWTLCNYRMNLFWYYFKDGLLSTLFTIKKETILLIACFLIYFFLYEWEGAGWW